VSLVIVRFVKSSRFLAAGKKLVQFLCHIPLIQMPMVLSFQILLCSCQSKNNFYNSAKQGVKL